MPNPKAGIKPGSIVDDIRKVAEDLGRPPTQAQYFSKGKYNEWQVRKNFKSFSGALKALGINPEKDPLVLTKITKLEEENQSLQKQVKELSKQALGSQEVRDLIAGLDTSELTGDYEWISGCRQSKSTHGIGTLVLSDIHFDERVFPSQIGYVNAYNREIAKKRLEHTFKASIMLLKDHMSSPDYEGLVLDLGGDLLSGNIHEELAETNEACINESILELADILISGAGALADEFGKILVVGVTGNHGRMHRKPRMKNRAFENFEWLIYQMMVRYFKTDKRFSFLIPDGSDAQYQVYGTNFLLTHGDQFRGGTGISGVYAPLMLGSHRKQRRQAQVKKAFDVMIMGHWHWYMHAEDMIINGSVKGYDEFASQLNLPYQGPKQALFLNHPDYGITYRMPVLCDSYEGGKSGQKANASQGVKIW